jgi:hypothetical protein
MKLIIDQFEGDFAVCEKEDRTVLNINLRDLPAGAEVGDVLIIEGENFKIDTVQSAKRKEMLRLLALYNQEKTDKI